MQPPLYRKIVSFYNAVIKIIAYSYEFFIVFYVLAVIIIKHEIFLHICPDRHIDISKLLCKKRRAAVPIFFVKDKKTAFSIRSAFTILQDTER